MRPSDMMTPAQRFATFRGRCRRRGLRLTAQREVLLQVLSRARHHPTADDLYRSVKKRLRSVSPATVYRNVQQLVDAGVISTLDRAGAMQYDANPEDHHHFVCESCGAVVDVYLARVSYRIDTRRSPLAGTIVRGCDVQLRGRCSRCREKA